MDNLLSTSVGRPMTQFESSFAKFNQLGNHEQMKKRAITAFLEADEVAEKKRKILSSESPERDNMNDMAQESLNDILGIPPM